MQNERSRTRRTLYKETDTLWYNLKVIDFFTNSCNAKTQINAEGLMRKKAIHIQRRNYGYRNTEEKQLIEHGLMDILGV